MTEFGADSGIVYKDKYVTIPAFDVKHGSWKPGMAVGYRIEAPGKKIMISDDTRPTDNLVEHAQGADILLHEVMSKTGLEKLPQKCQDYMRSAHTMTSELADIACRVDPPLMIHPLFLGEADQVLTHEM